jgi:FixJ family two-component response regulator
VLARENNKQSVVTLTVYIIDNDKPTSRALGRLMRAAGFHSVLFTSVDGFLQSGIEKHNACVVTDVHMPGVSALALPSVLRKRGIDIPVIFLTADYSSATREQIHKAGGRGYFRKPVDDHALIDMIRWTSKER